MDANGKNKSNTKQKLIDAVGEILINEGFQNLGINNIANKAGVNKVLIYRYFGDLNGLTEAYARQKEFWISENNRLSTSSKIENTADAKQAVSDLFKNAYLYLVKNADIQEIKRWELLEKNHIIETVGKEIEKLGTDEIKKLSEILGIEEETGQTTSAIILAGLYYLALRAKTTEFFNGINIQTKEGQDRILNGIDIIFNKLLK